MRHGRFIALGALALLAACSGSEGNVAANDTNAAADAEEGALNMAISGDELSPIPEAEDDMIANGSGGDGNAAGNPSAPRPEPAPAPPPGEP